MRTMVAIWLGLIAGSHAEARGLAGRLAYLRAGAAYVQRLDRTGTKPVKLPYSEGATLVALAPPNGTALYAVAVGEQQVKVVLSAPPYRFARRLRMPLQKGIFSITWTADGRFAFVRVSPDCWQYTARTRHVTRLPYEVLATSGNGGVVAVPTEKGLKVRWRATGREVEIFSAGRPEKVFNALRRTGRPRWYGYFLAPGIPRHPGWNVEAALSPDGRRVYLACDVGVPEAMNAQIAYVFLGGSTHTGAVRGLPWAGGIAGLVFDTWRVSPDGAHVLAVMDGKYGPGFTAWTSLLDLRRLSARELRWPTPSGTAGWTGSESAAAWSPDSRYVAVPQVRYPPGGPPVRTVLIRAVRSGRDVRRLEDAAGPSWATCRSDGAKHDH